MRVTGRGSGRAGDGRGCRKEGKKNERAVVRGGAEEREAAGLWEGDDKNWEW